MLQYTVFIILLLQSISLPAMQRYYSTYSESRWEVKSSPIHCELIHRINRYGDGRFVYTSGGELAFQLHSLEVAPRDSVTSLLSEAPFWRGGKRQELAELTLNQGRMPIYVGGRLALRMLYELQQGHHPTFHYKDWADFQDDVYVSVSSVNFHNHIEAFQRCMANALPYGPDKVKDTIVYFASNKHQLSQEQRKRLDEIVLFAGFDPSMRIELVGHADGRGTRRYNLKLSKKRTASVKQYLLAQGLRPQQLSVKAHGESRPAASNRSEKGRSTNRRVDVIINR